MKKQILLRTLLVFPALASLLALMSAPHAYAADCNQHFLTMPPWYRGLTEGTDCQIKLPNVSADDNGQAIRAFAIVLALNIVEIMLNIVAYVTIAFIIVGGFKYITSAGSPDGNEKGRKTITNAVIGLLISMVSIGIINAVVGGLTSSNAASGTTNSTTNQSGTRT